MMTKSEWEQLGDAERELALTMYDRAIADGITDPVVLDATLMMQATATIFNRHQQKKRMMESYTFRCVNDDCEYHDQPINGITMSKVIDDGGPICGLCGDDLELIGPDGGANALEAKLGDELMQPLIHRTADLVTQMHRRRNAPTAYRPVPGPPVNPSEVVPPTA